jgi:hypothetical protein
MRCLSEGIIFTGKEAADGSNVQINFRCTLEPDHEGLHRHEVALLSGANAVVSRMIIFWEGGDPNEHDSRGASR